MTTKPLPISFDKTIIPEEEHKKQEDLYNEGSNFEKSSDEDEAEEIIDLDNISNEDTSMDKNRDPKMLTQNKENLNTQVSGDGQGETSDRRGLPLKLQTIDINFHPKEDIVNFLMKKDLFGSCSSLELDAMANYPFKTSRKRNQKYMNVESSFKQNKSKPNYLLSNSVETGHPEMTYDFNTACKKVARQVAEGKNEDRSLRLLLSKKSLKNAQNLEATKRDNIATKVDFYLNKKIKKIENIKDKVDEDNMKGCTFHPSTNNPTNITNQRPFEEFLNFQKNHLKKVNESVKTLKEEKENKKLQAYRSPAINKNSNKIFEEKLKSEDPVFMRLYKKQFEPKKKPESSKKEKKHNEHTEERINKLYNDEFVKQKKIKDLTLKIVKDEKTEVDSLFSSNKIVYQKFKEQFKKEIAGLDKNTDNAPLTHLNLMQIYSLFLRLKFISKEFEKYFLNNSVENNNNPSNNNDLLLNLNESKLKFTEKKLVQDIFENLKNENALVHKDDLFVFLLSVINLYEFYLIKVNKNNFNEKEILEEVLKKKINDEEVSIIKKTHKKDINSYILSRVEEKFVSSIVSTRKYVGFDNQNKAIITLQMAQIIHKDFNFLSINNSNANHSLSKKEKILKPNLPFRPTTNPNSDKLSSNFRRKIQIDISETNLDMADKIKSTNTAKNQQNHYIEKDFEQNGDNKFNINYIKLLLIKKKKREKLMAKKREENESKELVECSFNPKINNDYPVDQQRNDRFENLYRIGKEQIANRSDRKSEDVEREKNEKECTYKPSLTQLNIDFSENNNTFDENSYSVFFDRIKKGRHEKKLKEQVNSRGPLSTLEEIETNESKLNQEKKDKREKKAAFQDKSNSLEKSNNNSSKPPKEKRSENEGLNMNLKAFNKKKDDAEKKEEKKEVIPLLIIDVNLRPGEKKKIYVFDGDTAEGLAEKFSKEHSLDVDTKNKLKVLIQSHMSKLLMRIEEENHSINSEKSSSNIFQ